MQVGDASCGTGDGLCDRCSRPFVYVEAGQASGDKDTRPGTRERMAAQPLARQVFIDVLVGKGRIDIDAAST